jgi:hypothetical protein
MSLFLEMFLLLVLAGLLGMFVGWVLHGKCDDYDTVEYKDEAGGA